MRSAFIRRGGLLLKDPLLAAGLVTMKGLELAAVAAGAVASIGLVNGRVFRIIWKGKDGR
jgi:hypothetical protein